MNLNSILIGSEDPQRLADYYTKLFGEPMWNVGRLHRLDDRIRALTSGPHSEVSGRNVHPGWIIWNIESADVKGDFERFKAAGATVVRDPYNPDQVSDDGSIATFADPDDNYFPADEPDGPVTGLPHEGARHDRRWTTGQ